MKQSSRYVSLLCAVAMLFAAILGCGKKGSSPQPEWTKARKVAGKEQGLSHVSGIVVDDKFAYVTMGGTIADQNQGTSGLRKISLDSGEVTNLDNGQTMPQSENGGIASDEKFVYWNAGGRIWRIAKEGGQREAVASEYVGIGVDLVVDDERVYWANHGYYSADIPTRPSPIYMVPKQGGATAIFVDQQHIPHSLVADEGFVYWVTPSSILKQAKSGGTPQVVYQATNNEGVDELAQDAGNLYFGFRGAGESRWALRRVSKQGGEPQTLVKRYSTKPVAVDDTNIYFFDEEGMTSDVICKVAKSGGEVTKLDTGYSSGVIAQSKTLIYLAGLDNIYSLAK
ncbi:MAG TPA: hypothetical protein VMS31_19320 [Pyrinomonadaceae bacterium]|nr:hypothetical protein [Pyrinomonadaceae bacterium]